MTTSTSLIADRDDETRSLVDDPSFSAEKEDSYGGTTTDDDPSILRERRKSTPEETAATLTLIKERNTVYNPKCLFHAEAWDDGTASIGNEILNLVKNIVGSGGLSLPAGMAAFGNQWTAVFPALLVILAMGVLNAYSFSLIGRVSAVTKSKTYQECWDRTVGRRHGTKYNIWVGLVVTGKAILGCWSFSIVIASTCTPLARSLGFDWTKTETLVGITLVVLLPLCLLERLSSLAIFSLIGQIGTGVTACTMILRYFDGSYREGGRFYDDLPPEHLPQFGTKGAMSFFSPQALILISILSTGYVAHYNASKYYYELRDHTTGRFNVVVNASFFSAAITYMCISTLGFLTFGENSAGFILDNYSYRDPLAALSRFGVALSVIFAYPLLFQGGRDGLWDLLGQTSSSSSCSKRTTTILLLSTVTVLAIVVSDLTFVLSFGGATLSSAIIYIFPPLMFQSLVLNCTCVATYTSNWEVRESEIMMWVGGILGVCGAVVTVVRTFF
ncbi:Sodium-coupled neutral amino acid transporter 1 [Seminavis robusta]|uniref:Sodium-coupled neutral amino acid transporter 1 n=1 Tax=Seminavis robusta TaxID=568900 RepID=A0A9N8E1S2_9STRA|nr:Sodium-coupled neutral amino acid transporter 1 [Seminavis robusta]|eukprot:Sro471_g149620.1 Sodium-coupled neutral amino acid transporter 1 (501) ;mRNA; r:5568-7173